jgi:pyrroline-5-carboxylate reductase
MNKPTIAVIGAGNMGMSIVGGLIADGYPAEKLWISNPSAEKLDAAKQKFNINTSADNKAAATAADVVILAVKPIILNEVATELSAIIQQKKPLVISVAAGIREHSLQHWLGGNIAIARAMPNTPALIGAGATGLFANSFVSPAQHNLVETILRAVGIVVWLDKEILLDAVTALSGSGPAYYFLFMECMQAAGEKMGIPRDTARLLTLQTAYGATRMALESEETLEHLRKRVTSPKGTTERAIDVFQKENLSGIIYDALKAAQQKGVELSDMFGGMEKKDV